MIRIILFVIGCWVLYKLIFDLIIPVYRSTKVMRGKFREMQQQMQEQMNQQASQHNYTDPSQAKSSQPEASKGDYIEFEEVK